MKMNDIKSDTNLINYRIPDYKKLVSPSMIHEIRNVKDFAQSQYANLDIVETLAFYTKRYVRQLFDFTKVDKNTIVADIGAGFGWLSMAFAYSTDAQIIAIDVDEPRLYAGKQIAYILGVGNKISWGGGALGRLPLRDNEANVVYCIEVLEHTQKSTDAVRDLCRASKDLVILTTPNLWFPIISHDTQLPFCHWLPIKMRRMYARLFNRENEEHSNLFWSPYSLHKNMAGFTPISRWLHYSSYKRFKDTFPLYLPYGKGKYVKKMGLAKYFYYGLVSRFGMYSHWAVPSLASVFKKKQCIYI